MPIEHEAPWKELLEQDAERAIAFFYPDIHADIDWGRDVESLEQEFRKLAPESLTGKRIVDKLLMAYQRGTGDPRYLHLEVQSYVEEGFARRVYVYNSRAEDRFGQPVVSLPILIDGDPDWLPAKYESSLYGTTRTLTFRATKLLGYPEAALAADPSPVALMVLAWQQGRKLGEDHEAILAAKVRLVRLLSRCDVTGGEMRRWLGYFDWLLRLPPEYTARLWAETNPNDKEKPMPRISDLERYLTEKGVEKGQQIGLEKGLEKGQQIGLEKGQQIGLVKAIALGLKLKFGAEGLKLLPHVETIEDLSAIQAIYDAIEPAATLDDIGKLIPTDKPPA